MPSDSKAPAFQFYPKDFLTDEKVAVMSAAARGAYITLLCHCWLEGGLPADADKLHRLSGVVLEDWSELWPEIEPCFRSNGNGRLTHPRLDRERKKQAAYRKMKSDAGKKGAAKRWSDSELDGSAKNLPLANDSPPSPSSSPSPTYVPPPPSPRSRAGARSERFAKFWSAYPKKVEKKAAEKAFERAERDGMPPLEDVLAALERQKQSRNWNREGGQYIKYPATWLNKGCWADEVEPAGEDAEEGWYVVRS